MIESWGVHIRGPYFHQLQHLYIKKTKLPKYPKWLLYNEKQFYLDFTEYFSTHRLYLFSFPPVCEWFTKRSLDMAQGRIYGAPIDDLIHYSVVINPSKQTC